MPVLYHYSPLMHLPGIMTGGLSRGDIAHPNPTVCRQAVSLTTQTDPDRLACWGNRTPLARKTAVRYVCRLDDGDPMLEPSRQTWKRLGVPPKFMSRLDPLGQSKWWSFYHGTIPPERYTVQLRSVGGYVEPTADQLAAVVRAVAMERDRYESVPHPVCPAVIYYAPKNPDASDHWLLEELFPADRFRVAE
jgi:hypothetical protein